MSYYDNVKDNVKEKGGNSNKASFDTLKEEAEKTSVEEDEDSDDGTPIEVLEEGGLNKQNHSSSRKNTSQNNTNKEKKVSHDQANTQSSGKQQVSRGESVDLSSVEDKLDRLIEQNDRIIEVLESFGQ